jgi:predicted RNA methylase
MKHKKELDQFFTNPTVALQCAKVIKKYINPEYIIEPSAGGGALIDAAKEVFSHINMVAFDIDPKRSDIKKRNFLSLYRPATHNKTTVVFANPPFGHKAALAIKFLNHAAEMADTLAFILPLQLRKWSAQSKVDATLKLVYDEILPENSFIFDDSSYNVRCCFQIWRRAGRKNLRLKNPPTTSHPDFKMWQYNNTKTALHVFNNKFDFAVPRQGYADYSRRETARGMCEKTTQWILFAAKNKKILTRLKRLDFNQLSLKNTTTPGFGKADVVQLYSGLYDK